MITYYNKKDLVNFGKYLLSKERVDLFKSHPHLEESNLSQRLKEVHHSDVENWKHSLRKQ